MQATQPQPESAGDGQPGVRALRKLCWQPAFGAQPTLAPRGVGCAARVSPALMALVLQPWEPDMRLTRIQGIQVVFREEHANFHIPVSARRHERRQSCSVDLLRASPPAGGVSPPSPRTLDARCTPHRRRCRRPSKSALQARQVPEQPGLTSKVFARLNRHVFRSPPRPPAATIHAAAGRLHGGCASPRTRAYGSQGGARSSDRLVFSSAGYPSREARIIWRPGVCSLTCGVRAYSRIPSYPAVASLSPA